MSHMVKDQIVTKCHGCEKAGEDETCRVYVMPGAQWRRGNCPMATHIKKEVKDVAFKLNPLKASKRGVK